MKKEQIRLGLSRVLVLLFVFVVSLVNGQQQSQEGGILQEKQQFDDFGGRQYFFDDFGDFGPEAPGDGDVGATGPGATPASPIDIYEGMLLGIAVVMIIAYYYNERRRDRKSVV